MSQNVNRLRPFVFATKAPGLIPASTRSWGSALVLTQEQAQISWLVENCHHFGSLPLFTREQWSFVCGCVCMCVILKTAFVDEITSSWLFIAKPHLLGYLCQTAQNCAVGRFAIKLAFIWVIHINFVILPERLMKKRATKTTTKKKPKVSPLHDSAVSVCVIVQPCHALTSGTDW